MGFMNDKQQQQKEKKPNVTYLEVADGQTKRVRPLDKVPLSRWVHAINSVEQTVDGKKQTLRYFSTVPCVSVNKSGQGCDPCTTKDPLWHLLSHQQQHTQKGQVTHFPKRQQFELAVWDYELNDVRILRGKQVFEGMNVWWDSRKTDADRDARRLDWIVSKTGSGERSKWTISPDEISTFEITEEIKAKLEECKARYANDTKMPSTEEFMKRIYGSSGLSQTPGSVVAPAVPQPVAIAQSAPAAPPPTVVAAPPPPAPTGKQANSHITDFAKWLNQQPEFQGPGLTKVLIPALQQAIGSVSYQHLDQAQVTNLKSTLEGVLKSLRGS